MAPQTGFELRTFWLTVIVLAYCESPSDEPGQSRRSVNQKGAELEVGVVCSPNRIRITELPIAHRPFLGRLLPEPERPVIPL